MRDYWDNRWFPVDRAYVRTPTAFGVFAHQTVSEGEPPRSYWNACTTFSDGPSFRVEGTSHRPSNRQRYGEFTDFGSDASGKFAAYEKRKSGPLLRTSGASNFRCLELQAAAYLEGFAGDPVGFGGRHEGHGLGDVFRCAETAERSA